jgi:predicted dienelactone hydrolase
MSKLAGLRRFVARAGAALAPSDPAWRGAAYAVQLAAALILIAFLATEVLPQFSLQKLGAAILLVGALLAVGALGLLLQTLVQRLPRGYRLALLLLAPLTVLFLAPAEDWRGFALPLVLLLLASLIGGSLTVLCRSRHRPQRHPVAVLGLLLGSVGLAAGLYAIFSAKEPANPLLAGHRLEDRTLDLANPGLPGRYAVRSWTYGSGKDRHRPEFAANVTLVSRTVDGARLIDNWDGLAGWLRTSYWGFDPTALPLQARVWFPVGDGPFPLVLIVHGNHAMEDSSDPGYAYLGEHLASRGIIVASVDANFLNSSLSDQVEILRNRPGLEEENDARGWLLLEHLAQWRDWSRDPAHRLFGKVDMERIALIGHSRGGEAVAVAAAFNRLAQHPDDANQRFDFGFNLRGVIAIAPVDGQYRPRDSGTPIEDVNYFAIHGSMDGDVQSFEGAAQYARVAVRDATQPRFKASLYVVGANHGQFNTTWENMDVDLLRAWTLDLDGIMPAEAQRDIARVYFGAFLEIVLHDRREYLPIFADSRRAAAWLPDTFYLNHFADSSQQAIADFEEDIDLRTTSLAGGVIEGVNLSRWYETRVKLKWDTLDTHAAVYAWDSRANPATARVDLRLPPGFQVPGPGATLLLSLSQAGVGTLPDDWKDRAEAGSTADEPVVPEDKTEDALLDWTIVLRDRNGVEASLPLSHDSALYPLVRAVPRRASFLDDNDATEVLFRTHALALDDFAAAQPALDSTGIKSISLVFDRSEKGAIMVEDISIRGGAR